MHTTHCHHHHATADPANQFTVVTPRWHTEIVTSVGATIVNLYPLKVRERGARRCYDAKLLAATCLGEAA